MKCGRTRLPESRRLWFWGRCRCRWGLRGLRRGQHGLALLRDEVYHCGGSENTQHLYSDAMFISRALRRPQRNERTIGMAMLATLRGLNCGLERGQKSSDCRSSSSYSFASIQTPGARKEASVHRFAHLEAEHIALLWSIPLSRSVNNGTESVRTVRMSCGHHLLGSSIFPLLIVNAIAKDQEG